MKRVSLKTFSSFGVLRNTTKTPSGRPFRGILPFLLALLFLSAASANAAVFTVDTLADNESNTCSAGACTLREAVTAANGSGGADSINFQSGLTGTITLTGGYLPLFDSVTITGPGAANLSISGNNANRVFVVSGSGVTANVSGLTVTGGEAVPILIGLTLIGDGGGILNTNGGTLNLTDVHITGNHSTSLGGGIATRAILLVTTTTNIYGCLISGNTSTLGGGGLSNIGTTIISSAVTTMGNTTVTNNSALAEGGGISNVAGTMNMTNNTVSHNQSLVAGGGIVNVAGALVGIVNVRNNIFAKNNALLGINLISSDGLGIFNSLGYNLVGNNLDVDVSFSASVVVGGVHQPNVNADLVGSVSAGFTEIDPNLGALQNNGGPVHTRGIPTFSPATNKADNCVATNTCSVNPGGLNPSVSLTVDNRGSGFSRFSGAAVDIGAYELQFGPSSAEVSVSGMVSNTKGSGIPKATVYLSDSHGNTFTAMTSSFGYFTVSNVPAGETYLVTVVHRQYSFSPQVMTILEEVTGLNLTPQ